jgi:hypothetical protein
MLRAGAAVAENVGVRAARVFERVGQDGQPVKGPLFVNALRQLPRRAVLVQKPSALDEYRTKGAVE